MTDEIVNQSNTPDIPPESPGDVSAPSPAERFQFTALQYTEANATFRHYADSILRARGIMMVQGIAILIAAAYLIQEKQFVESFVVALFGVLLTAALAAMQWHYRSTCLMTVEFMKTLETEFFGLHEVQPTYWVAFKLARDSVSLPRRILRLSTVYLPFILFIVAFAEVMVTSAYFASKH